MLDLSHFRTFVGRSLCQTYVIILSVAAFAKGGRVSTALSLLSFFFVNIYTPAGVGGARTSRGEIVKLGGVNFHMRYCVLLGSYRPGRALTWC